MLTLLHGTSSANRETLFKEGLREPFLTDNADQAAYYALEAVDEKGGSPILLQVQVDPKFLRYDGAAMDEPVGCDGLSISALEEKVQRAWNAAVKKNPKWKEHGYVVIPETEYQISLKTVGSCWAQCVIPPAQIAQVPFEKGPAGFYRLLPEVPSLSRTEVYITPPAAVSRGVKR